LRFEFRAQNIMQLPELFILYLFVSGEKSQTFRPVMDLRPLAIIFELTNKRTFPHLFLHYFDDFGAVFRSTADHRLDRDAVNGSLSGFLEFLDAIAENGLLEVLEGIAV
jgi:hypothetical protein